MIYQTTDIVVYLTAKIFMTMATAKKINNQSDLSNEVQALQYMPHIRRQYLVHKNLAIAVAVTSTIGALVLFLLGEAILAITLGVLFLSLAGAIFIFSYFTFKPLFFDFSANVLHDSIDLNRRKKKEKIYFKNIEKVKIYYLEGNAGWFKLFFKNGKSSRKFRTTLRGGYKILEAIAKTNPGLISEEKILKYKQTNEFCYHFSLWLSRKQRRWFKFLLKFSLPSVALAYSFVFFQELAPVESLIYGVFICLCGLVVSHNLDVYLFGKEFLRMWKAEEVSESIHTEKLLDLKLKTDALYFVGCVAAIALIALTYR